MLKQVSKLVLLVALLATLVISSVPAFASNKSCQCLNLCFKGGCPNGGCQFDKKTSQCVNTGCQGSCVFI